MSIFNPENISGEQEIITVKHNTENKNRVQ